MHNSETIEWAAKSANVSSARSLGAIITILSMAGATIGGCGLFDLGSGDERVIMQIGAGGGEVSMPGVAKVIVPPGAFPGGRDVSIIKESSNEQLQAFRRSATIFAAGEPLSYQVRINTGQDNSSANEFVVHLMMPAEFKGTIPADAGVEVFALVRQSSDAGEAIDSWSLLPSDTDPGTGDIVFRLPTLLLGTYFSSAQDHDVLLTLAPTPGTKQSASSLAKHSSFAAQGTCEASTMSAPLATMTVQEPFGELRKDKAGHYKLHWGVDLAAAPGTSVMAASDGVVTFAGAMKGYGNTIVIKHKPIGSHTLYAHLSGFSNGLQSGKEVKRGDVIGSTGTTGNAEGTSPHLHFELAPAGTLFNQKKQADPMACTGNQANGNIRVSDNGQLADDAFAVMIDGNEIGRTSIGASNSVATGPLRIGEYKLTLKCITAPDNYGTYQIDLSGNTVFKSGNPTRRSGTIPMGGSITETIVVYLRNDNNRDLAGEQFPPIIPNEYAELP